MSELQRKIKQMRIKDGMTVGGLVKEMDGAAFGAGRLAEAVDIYEGMLRDDTTKFFGLAGAMIPAGMRQVVRDLIEDGYIDVLVTTGANLVHDLIEAWGGHHYRGTSCADDIELRRQQINRIFDVFLPENHFTAFEKRLLDVFAGMDKKDMGIRELLTEVGRRVNPTSIIGAAARKDVPIFCPAIADSAIGLQAWLHTQTQKLNVDTFRDMHEFMDICYKARKTGAVFIGGGVPKNFILQSMIVTPKGGFDYAIQLTMDRPETGGLSGATLDEAKSWGKVGESARAVTVYADATITLPLHFILEASRSSYPKEFAGLLRANEDIITDVLLLPGTESSEVSAVMRLYMMPMTVGGIGSVHSHPSPDIAPSKDDLRMFGRTGDYHVIVGHPYTERSWACYDAAGKRRHLPVLDAQIKDDLDAWED